MPPKDNKKAPAKGGDKKKGGNDKSSSSSGDKMGTVKEVSARHILCEKMGKAEEVMKKVNFRTI